MITERRINIPSDLQTLYHLYQQEIHATTLQSFKDIKSCDEIIFPTLAR